MKTSRKPVNYESGEPFRPFRFKMAGGQSFEIRHHEKILVEPSTVRFCAATGDDDDEK
jgi:hypothetical protein